MVFLVNSAGQNKDFRRRHAIPSWDNIQYLPWLFFFSNSCTPVSHNRHGCGIYKCFDECCLFCVKGTLTIECCKSNFTLFKSEIVFSWTEILWYVRCQSVPSCLYWLAIMMVGIVVSTLMISQLHLVHGLAQVGLHLFVWSNLYSCVLGQLWGNNW